MRRLTRKPSDLGLTLIELLVAIIVLAIGSLAAIRAADQSRYSIAGELPRLLVETALRNRAQEIQLLGPFAGLPDTVQIAGQAIQMTQDRDTTEGGLIRITLGARASTGEAAGLVVYLPPGMPR